MLTLVSFARFVVNLYVIEKVIIRESLNEFGLRKKLKNLRIRHFQQQQKQ